MTVRVLVCVCVCNVVLDCACFFWGGFVRSKGCFVGASLSFLLSPWRSFQLNYKEERPRPWDTGCGLRVTEHGVARTSPESFFLLACLFSCV